jgi:putative PIN family toxin of toxin-antitoxin system
MRLVIDTDVMVAALQSPTGASRRLFMAVVEREVDLVASVPLFLEWEAVLKRPAVLAAAALSIDDMDIVLDQLASVLLPTDLWFLWRPQLADPNDEMVLETAINGRAAAIVTFNRRHFAAAARFGIAVLLPRDVVRSLP